jgi:cellulose synthase/poly-beta-1,6-N-acetylglucosamine synthase-like glycosyltransferase
MNPEHSTTIKSRPVPAENMHTIWQYLLLGLYSLGCLGLLIYSSHCYFMTFSFLRRQKQHRALIQREIIAYNHGRPESAYPFVTIQLPLYNERTVAERLIRSAAAVDYPRDRFEIQVLDDSQDETRQIVDRAAAAVRQQNVNISVIRRGIRKDFKAGALAHAIPLARGQYLAIFDADFIVPREFLKRMLALIDPYPDVACVQGRWGHANRDENWLTRAQSVGIDSHFAAEQGARSYNDLCMNFNGTAGVWRRAAIDHVGGWAGDTLTEDLDLSYRVQLNGYRIRFDFDLECPAELPSDILALKSQQRRWAKGSVETALKLIPQIVRSPRLNWLQKTEAVIHLTHYFVALLMILICILTLPMLLWIPVPKLGWLVASLWTLIGLSAIAPCIMYTASGCILRRGWFSFSHWPAMLVAGTGLCLNNAWAVIEALIGRKTDFIRTPKSGSVGGQRSAGAYRASSNLVFPALEIALGTYCMIALHVYLHAQKYLFGFFIAAYAAGLLTFGFLTLKSKLWPQRAACS